MRERFFEDIFEGNFGAQERTILAYIYRGEKVTSGDIAKLIYGTSTAAAQTRVRIRVAQIRPKLIGTGWEIPKRPHRDRDGFYELVRTAPEPLGVEDYEPQT